MCREIMELLLQKNDWIAIYGSFEIFDPHDAWKTMRRCRITLWCSWQITSDRPVHTYICIYTIFRYMYLNSKSIFWYKMHYLLGSLFGKYLYVVLMNNKNIRWLDYKLYIYNIVIPSNMSVRIQLLLSVFRALNY